MKLTIALQSEQHIKKDLAKKLGQLHENLYQAQSSGGAEKPRGSRSAGVARPVPVLSAAGHGADKKQMAVYQQPTCKKGAPKDRQLLM
jgi:hypothetical protein